MRLLNFCTGQVRTVHIGADEVKTGHIKTPVEGAWLINLDGPEGDQRAVHPDKVYAYARSGYDHWGQYLGVDPADWPDGFFGENLTLDSLDEHEIRIGDVFELGEAVLVVAGPRNPCAKLTWRLGQPPTFQKVFAQSGRTGVYFGVLRAGEVARGSAMRRIGREPDLPSVAETASYAASHATPPLEPLERLLDFPHLSPTMRHILHAKHEMAARAAEAAEGRWRGWRPFIIDRIVEEAADIRSYHLVPTDGGLLCRPRPGQFVSVRMQAADGQVVTRCWSLSAYGNAPDRYRITVRRQEGEGSNWMHAAEAGAEAMLRAPAGEFTLDMGAFRPLLLVAAGIGITPLLAMIQAHLTREEGAAPIFLIYGARTPQEQAFRCELETLAARHPGLHVTHVYSRSDTGARPAGRITTELVMEVLADLHVMIGERRIPVPWFEHEAYLCGPGDFCAALKAGLVARGANADRISYELFESVATEATEIEAAEVRFVRSGLACTWTAAADLSLLELAEQVGIEPPSDCRAGTCLTCRTQVVAGETTAGMGDGVLLCVGRPKTAMLELDC